MSRKYCNIITDAYQRRYEQVIIYIYKRAIYNYTLKILN